MLQAPWPPPENRQALLGSPHQGSCCPRALYLEGMPYTSGASALDTFSRLCHSALGGGGSDISGRSQEGSEGTRRSLQKPGASELGWQHQESWLAVELGAAFGIPCIPAKSMERGTVAAGNWGADDCPSVGEGRDSCWPKSPTGPGGVYCLGAWAGAPRIHCPEAGLGPHPEHFGSVSTQKGILEKRVRNPPACSLGDDPGGVNS